ncbi:MAG: STAS domain-containing protein [Gammaproteobacteria bacterium]|nr:STAS domain-containing protein [Gammaproteobacteria bacterium]
MINVKELEKDKCSVSLKGDMDIYKATEFKQEIEKIYTKYKSFVFDLSEISEIDTSCFQVLLQLKRECKKDDKEMQMVSHSQAILEVFELYGMESFFGDAVLLTSAVNDQVC